MTNQQESSGDVAVDVLIVGAGPAGYMAAVTLARYGVSFRLIDQRTECIQTGQAGGGFQTAFAALHLRVAKSELKALTSSSTHFRIESSLHFLRKREITSTPSRTLGHLTSTPSTNSYHLLRHTLLYSGKLLNEFYIF